MPLVATTARTLSRLDRGPAVRASAPRRSVLCLLASLASIAFLTALFEWLLRLVAR